MQAVDRRVDVREVGGVAVLLLGRADADEVHVGAVRRSHVGGEAQAARRDALGEDLGQAGLEERGFALRERGDLPFVDVDSDDVVADGCHGGGVHRAEVSASDDGEAHVTPRGSSMRWMPAAVGGGVLEAFHTRCMFRESARRAGGVASRRGGIQGWPV